MRSRDEVLNHLQSMDPYDFENFIAELWEHHGYSTTVQKGSGDRGIDVIARKRFPTRQKVLIQAKRYSTSNKVGSREIRLYATLYQQEKDADEVVVVTTSEFTSEARQLASDLSVTIVDGTDLYKMIEQLSDESLVPSDEEQEYSNNSSLRAKRRTATSYNPSTPWKVKCPFCDKRVHYSVKGMTQHWAHSRSCNFSQEKRIETVAVPGNWDSLVRRVFRERSKKTEQETPTSDCPYCDTELKHRSSEAYVDHWTDGTCTKTVKSLPRERPSKVPVETWWGIKDEFRERKSRWYKRNRTSTNQGGASKGNQDEVDKDQSVVSRARDVFKSAYK